MRRVTAVISFLLFMICIAGCSTTGRNNEQALDSSENQTSAGSDTADDTSRKSFSLLKDHKPDKPYAEVTMERLQQESTTLEKRNQTKWDAFEKKASREQIPKVEPVFPNYVPLEDHTISLSMVDADLGTILYLIADTAGMNLILGNKVNEEKHKVTLHFQKASAKTVFEELIDRFDLCYEIKGNIIRVNAFQERIFKLNFIDTNTQTTFDIGGDVLGAGSSETATGLTGSVKLTGTGSKKGNAYDLLEQMVKEVKSNKGVSMVNRLAGSLYIKDRPSNVAVIAKLVNHYRQMLARQILIEARIIEVTLADGYEYGIDWELLRTDTGISNTKLNEASFLQNALYIAGANATFNFTAAIDALEEFGDVKIVSNPTIRAKHGTPAVISVGDSITYKKSVEVEEEENENSTTETVEVEVSTVFDGLILGVIPFIEENGTINLLINPVKSDVDTSSIEDPEEVSDGESISLPKVGIKEINTTISMKSGDVVILGGLISKEETWADSGVPLLSKLPLLGYLFSNEYMRKERRELVIILNVNIIE